MFQYCWKIFQYYTGKYFSSVPKLLTEEPNMSPIAESKLAVENGDVSQWSSWVKDFRLEE